MRHLIGLSVLALLSCDRPAPTIPGPKVPLARRQDAPRGVRVSGVIRLKGEKPAPKMVNVPQVYQKLCGCTELDPGDLVVGKDAGVRWAYVEIPGPLKSFEPAEAKIVQKQGLYTPRVSVVAEKTKVTFENGDGETHNVHLATEDLRESIFNVITQSETSHEARIERTGRFQLLCDIHSWMRGWVVVTGNPWHALSGADGRFEIEGVTPGAHEIRVWHERLGEKKVEFEAIEGKPVDLLIELEAR